MVVLLALDMDYWYVKLHCTVALFTVIHCVYMLQMRHVLTVTVLVGHAASMLSALIASNTYVTSLKH